MSDVVELPQEGETVYLIHFDQPYKGAKHYMGYTHHFDRRMARHRKGHGAHILKAIQKAGIDWKVVRTWKNAGIEFEHRIKKANNSARFCPICNPKTYANHMPQV